MSISAPLFAQDGTAFLWAMEVSNDNFSTIAHRWATSACHIGGKQFDARIAKIGKFTKGFGLDNFPTVSTFAVALDNTKFDMDWLVDVTGGPVEFTYRFKLYLCLFDPKNITPTNDVEPFTQVMGTFGILSSPTRSPSTVTLSLGDDSMGKFNELATSPTIRDWIADAGSTGDNCLLAAQSPIPYIDFDTPLPLAFGPTAEALIPSYYVSGGPIGARVATGTLAAAGFTHTIIVCCTTSSDAVTANDVQRLDATYRDNAVLINTGWDGAGKAFTIPPSFTIPNDPSIDQTFFPAGTYTIWQALKSQVITKDGKSWKILSIAFAAQYYVNWAILNLVNSAHLGGAQPDGSITPVKYMPPTAPGWQGQDLGVWALGAIDHFTVTGFPFSAQTVKTSPYQRGLDVLTDLISFYSHGSSSDLDTASFALAAQSNTVWVQQTLLPLKPVGQTTDKFLTPVAAAIAPGTLRKAMQELAASIAVDVFFTWAGKLAVSAGWFDFASITSTPQVVSETRCVNIGDRKPSQGERWCFYNRVFVVGPDGQTRGPFDNVQSVAAYGAIPRTIQGKWLLTDTNGGDPSYAMGLWQLWPRLEAKERTLLTLTTDREILKLDLGSLFSLSWTRGNSSAVYTAAVFRIEQLGINPADLSVDVEAVWVSDLLTVEPYLLDDEAHFGVAASVAGSNGTVTVADHSATATFSSFNPVTGGVVAGDMLLIEDTTEADNTFKRYKTLRITARTATTVTVVDDIDGGDYGGGGVLGTWAIFHGKTTYPTAGSDPTNYPSGSAMYGKVTNAGGVFSDSSAGNQLLDG